MKSENRQDRWHVTQEICLNAARDLLAESGFENTTMGDIASRAGVHIQTLYRHFPTKNALVSTLYQQEFRAALEAREVDVLAFWHDWIHRTAALLDQKEMPQEKGGSDALHHRTGLPLEYALEYIELLAESVAEDFGLDLECSVVPTLVANMIWGANVHAIKLSPNGQRLEVSMRVLDETNEIARGVISAAGGKSRWSRRRVAGRKTQKTKTVKAKASKKPGAGKP
ncbi:MAG: TetR/AcrR family transcriptional regulator [Pseudomonadota bacterium]